MEVQTLQSRLEEIDQQSTTILARASAEKRDLTDDETKEIDELVAEFKTTEANIGRMQAIANMGATLKGSAGRKVTPEAPRGTPDADDEDFEDVVPANMSGRREPNIVVHKDRKRWGWRSLGEMALAVRSASLGAGLDNRLAAQMAAASTYGSEASGADGGWAVAPDFRAEIMQKIGGERSLLGMTDQLQTSSNAITLPIDDTTPWQTSGGVQATWDGEAQPINQSKPALKSDTIKLNKLTALVPITDELGEDAPSLDSYLRKRVPEKMDFKISLAIVQGDGAGKPLGINNAPSTRTISKESSQAAATLNAKNIFKMYSAMYGPMRDGAVWLINQDVEPELFSMTIPIKNVAGTENVGGSVVYMPANGLSSSPYATLMGKPVIPTQACPTLGTKGDIIFVNLKQYMTVVKSTGLRVDTSMHIWFDQALQAYRFIFRLAGQPWWPTAASPLSGSNTMSWAVNLETRG